MLLRKHSLAAAVLLGSLLPAVSMAAGQPDASSAPSVRSALTEAEVRTLQKELPGEVSDNLKKMHAQWLEYRDANCLLARSIETVRGTGRGDAAEADCRERMERRHQQQVDIYTHTYLNALDSSKSRADSRQHGYPVPMRVPAKFDHRKNGQVIHWDSEQAVPQPDLKARTAD